MVLDQLGRRPLNCVACVRCNGALSRRQAAGVSMHGLRGVELDPPTDRLGARAEQLELRAKPVEGDDAVGVGAGDQPVLAAEAEKALASEVHAQLPRASYALRGR